MSNNILQEKQSIRPTPSLEQQLRLCKKKLNARHAIANAFLKTRGDEVYPLTLSILRELLRSPLACLGYEVQRNEQRGLPVAECVWELSHPLNKRTAHRQRQSWNSLWGRDLHEKEPLLSNTGLQGQQGLLCPRRLIIAPLLQGDRVLGQVAVANRDSDYDVEDLELLRALCDSIAPLLLGRLWIHRHFSRLESTIEERTRELQKSLLALKSAQSIGRIGSVELDLVTGDLHMSEEALRIFGLEGTSIDQLPDVFNGRVHPDHRDDRQEALRRAIETGVPVDKSFPIILPDGTSRWVHERCELLPGQSGEHDQMIGTFQDISEQRLRHERLAMFSMAVEQSAYWAVITDAEGTIIYANPAVFQLSGFSGDELIGKKPHLLASGLHPPEFYEELWATIRSGRTWRSIIENRTKTGDRLLLDMTIQPIKDGHGSITYFVSTARDLTAEREYENRIRHVRDHDSLTGLMNRDAFVATLESGSTPPPGKNCGTAIVVLDLDRFKMLNDVLGNTACDEILKHCASRLQALISSEDLLARLGSDEFGISRGGFSSSTEVAAFVGEKLLKAMAEPFDIDGREVTLTASVGIACFPDTFECPSRVVEQAHLALERARSMGGNRYTFFESGMNKHVAEFVDTLHSMRGALARNEFEVHYQPYIDLSTGRPAGMEALVRWRKPGGKLVPPGRFIPVLEETGMIGEVGQWILRDVARQLREWINHDLPVLPVSINISPIQFQDRDLPAKIQEVLQHHEIPSELVVLEITESSFMEDLDYTKKILNCFQTSGFKISVDDFGTGYSSLAYLKKLPVDNLKIDISFIRYIMTDPDSASIVTAIIQMASSLGLRTIAEGVENQQQYAVLRILRCDFVQGFLCARPMPAPDLARYLSAQLTSPA